MDVLLRALEDAPPGTALHVAGEEISWRDLRADADALAAPVRPGERVLVAATPSLRTCVAVAGVLRAGGVLVAANPDAAPAERAHVLADAAPHWVLEAGPLQEGPGAGSRQEEGELGIVVYTSGTTGPPKGAELPISALAACLDALADAWLQRPSDRLVHALPLFHVHGLVLGLLAPLRHGFPLAHPGRFDPAALDALLAAAPPGRGVLFGVPTTYHRLLAAGATAGLRGARLLVSGSAPLRAGDAAGVLAAAGQEPVERYGLTETLIVAAARADEMRRRGCVGRPLPGVEITIIDDDPHGCPGPGEVHVRGATLFRGYRARGPAPLADGWFATGDAASLEPDGALRIVGRIGSDLIKTGGFKVGAGEVEDVLAAHPWVGDVAVAGRADPDLGEVVVAWVVWRPDADLPADPATQLRDWARERLARHKRPRRVIALPALPRTALGKIRKAQLPDGEARD